MGIDRLITQRESKGVTLLQDGWHSTRLLAVDLNARVLLRFQRDRSTQATSRGSAFGEQRKVAEPRGDRRSTGNVRDIQRAVIPTRIATRIEVATVVWHVRNNEYARTRQFGPWLAIDAHPGVGESGADDLFENRLDVCPVATEFARFLKSVDNRCVHTKRSHDQEGVIVTQRDIDPPGLTSDLELLKDSRWFAGHPERVADQIGGPGAAMLKGDFGLCEQGKQMVDGPVAADDDEAIGVTQVVCRGDVPPADIELGESVAPRRGELVDGIGEALGFAAA